MPIVKHKKVAAAQAESVWLDLKGGIEKTKELIKQAKEQGADLLVLPELWLPGYPWYLWNLPFGLTIEYTLQYQQNSMSVESEEMKEIQQAAKQNQITISFGFSEKRQGSLYMSNAIILADGTLASIRRKWKPTGMERVLFGEASGDVFNNVCFDHSSLQFNIGNLQCWEHLLPLLKFQTFSKHEQIHCGSWPPIFPHGGMEHFGMSFEGIHQISSVYSMEGQAFTAMSTGLVSVEGGKKIGLDYALTGGVPPPGAFAIPPGGGYAAIFGPDGRRLTEPLDPTKEGFVFADLDPIQINLAKHLADPVGHYARPDLVRLIVNEEELSITEKKKNVNPIKSLPKPTQTTTKKEIEINGSNEN